MEAQAMRAVISMIWYRWIYLPGLGNQWKVSLPSFLSLDRVTREWLSSIRYTLWEDGMPWSSSITCLSLIPSPRCGRSIMEPQTLVHLDGKKPLILFLLSFFLLFLDWSPLFPSSSGIILSPSSLFFWNHSIALVIICLILWMVYRNFSAVSVVAVPYWKVFVFGGNSGDLSDGGSNPQGSYLNDLAVLDTGTHFWTRPTVIGTPPSARGETSIVFDPRLSRIILFGGW